MKKLLFVLIPFLALPVSAEKYVDLHPVNVVEEYGINKMLPGKIVPKRQSTLGFEVPGKIKIIHVDIGDKVMKDDLLAELEDSEALARLNEAKANLAMVQNIFERSKALDQAKFVSEQQLENEEFKFLIAQAQHQVAATKFRQTKIRAPYTGIIQSRFLDEGSIVNMSIPVLEILDSEYVEAKIALPRSLIDRVSLGQKYAFIIDGESVKARLTRLAPMSSRGSNNREGIFAFDTFFNPGATARLVLKVKELKRGTWVPLSALSQAEQGLWTVFTASAESTAQKEYVELIHIEDSMAYVSGTLKTGDMVIVGGASKVAAGQVILDSK